MDHANLLILSIGTGLVSFFTILALMAAARKPVYKNRVQLLLLNEQRFLQAAMQAIPANMLITAKVRLLDIITAKNARTGKPLEDGLQDLKLDFVLIDAADSKIRLCIELIMEGRTSTAKTVLLSRALRRAGIPHLKLPLVRYYDPARLRQIILNALDENAPTSM